MKVLVTGATGFVGSWVARELVGAGHAVRALVRATSKLDNLRDLAIERAEGDVLDAASVRRALEGCDAVVHAAGVTDFGGDSRRMYEVNATSVEVVLGAALEGGGGRRAVLTSSVAAMGGTAEPVLSDELTRSTAEEVGVDYMRSKYLGERAGLALAARGLAVCALRPGVILGPGDIYGSSATTFLALARGAIPAYVDGGSSFCDVRDVARAHVVALEKGAAGEAYIVAGENIAMRDLVARVAAVTGVPPPRRMPYAAAYAVAAGSELLARLFGRRPPISRQLVKASSLYTFVSSQKAAQALGYRTRCFEDSLRDTLRWFMERGRLDPTTPELRALERAAG